MTDNLESQPRLILLLGGARAGKSTRALQLAMDREQLTRGEVCFIATAQALDDDMAARIEKHQLERPAHWRTIEEPYRIDDALTQAGDAGVVILDCLTLFVSNWLLHCEHENECETTLRDITLKFLASAKSRGQLVICVSNEVGLGIVPESKLGRVFRDLLGRVNQDFARAADEVHLMIAGLTLQLKPSGQK